MDLAKLVVKLEAQTAQYVEALDKANKKLSKFASDQSVSLKSIAKGFAVEALAVGASLAVMTKSAVDNADHLNKMSQSTGVSVENLSKLQYAAELSNVSLEDLGKATKALSAAAAEAATSGTSKAAEAFKKLGVNVKNADGTLKGTDTLLLDVADSMSKIEDGTGKAALAQDILSKSSAAMIPFLNQGREGIKALTDEADSLNVTLSTESAQAAERFNDDLTKLETAGKGVANLVMQELVPGFTYITEKWLESAKAGGTLNAAAMFLADTFKVILTVGIYITAIFEQLGRVIYGVGAALVRFATGDFKLAAAEIKDISTDVMANSKNVVDSIVGLWTKKASDFKNATETMDKAAKKTIIFNDEEAKKKSDAAIKKLTEFSKNLSEQVATFNKGDAAATEYRLTIGSLSDDVKVAGQRGKELAKSIVAEADALEKLKNVQAVAQIDQQIQQLTGHTVEAAQAAFDLQNQQLKSSLIRQNDDSGLKSLETLRQLTIAQAEYNKLEEESQKIREDLATTEDRIQHSQEVGAINEFEALAKLDEARKASVEQLKKILDQQQQIADHSGNDALEKSAKQSRDQLDRLAQQTDLFRQKIRSTLEDAAGDEFGAFISGAKSASDAFSSLINDIESEISRFIAKDLVRRFFNMMSEGGSGGGGGGGGFLGTAMNFVGSLFGGSRDSGGRGRAGVTYFVGTPELFIPDTSGSFVPMDALAGGSGHVTQNIYTQGPMTQRSARQLELEASRRQRISASRLG